MMRISGTLASTLVGLTLVGCSGGASPAPGGGNGGEVEPADEGPAATTQVAGTFSMYGGAVGYAIALETQAENFESTSSIAVVADLGTAWGVETESSANPGYVIGLTVDKLNGKVTSAVMGKPGERGRRIKILDYTAPSTADAEDGVPEEVPISIGTFPAMKVVEDYGTSWTGTEPELKGILLKYASDSGGYELSALPDTTTETVSGKAVKVTKLNYSNGRTEWRTAHAVVASLRPLDDAPGVGLFRRSNGTSTTEVTSLETDARPQLRWE